MIRVLTDNNNLDLFKRTQVESIEYQPSRRITRKLLIFLPYLFAQLMEVRFIKLGT
jgi:hypothetical protein